MKSIWEELAANPIVNIAGILFYLMGVMMIGIGLLWLPIFLLYVLLEQSYPYSFLVHMAVDFIGGFILAVLGEFLRQEHEFYSDEED